MRKESRYAAKGGPHRYSDNYNAWKRAILRNDQSAVREADSDWRKAQCLR